MKIGRREFLKSASAMSLYSAAAIGTSSLATASRPDYKALVCVFLYGGMDNYDTILPYDQSSYDLYARTRRSLIDSYGGSRARDRLLQLAPGNAAQFGPRVYALPPELAPLHKLFRMGVAAIIGNVGPLAKPMTKIDLETGAAGLPERLFSHNDQRSMWMSLDPEGAPSGWGGRFADAHIASHANLNPAFTAVSSFGNDVFLTGQTARAYCIDPSVLPSIHALTLPRLAFERRLSRDAYARLRDHFASKDVGGTNLLQRDIALEHARAFANNESFISSLAGAAQLETPFPDTDLGQQLRAIARFIAIRADIGATRQVFFAGRRGFDTHSRQAGALPALHVELGQAIEAFFNAMQELGTTLDVTLFTASDFGRSLAVNGDGTDHGWGGHHFVVGGSVLGGRIYGDLPLSEFGHDYDAGGGRLIPTVALQQYAATLGRWFGLTQEELFVALPGLEAFPVHDLTFV